MAELASVQQHPSQQQQATQGQMEQQLQTNNKATINPRQKY